jgi:tRNA nucleotidyltransferase/poly(A) polymerase
MFSTNSYTTFTSQHLCDKKPIFNFHMNIQPTPLERKIFDLLKEFVAESRIPVELRVAGGWVRDKLLGLQSHDLDFALDTCTGEQFATALKQYLDDKHVENGHERRVASSLGIIQSNPEQSKHLEAATLSLFGQPVDFVNLRSEEYAEHSRIPASMAFGTPLQDALRRDLTINSLFYNVHRDMVEDWTGQGLADLRDGIIRTPLGPLVTLRDDPLRLLRAVRFAARFDYCLVPELRAAMQDAGVVRCFFDKISRERVGVETVKMCRHPSRVRALQLIADLPSVYPLLVGEQYADRAGLFRKLVQTISEERLQLTYHGALGVLFLPFSQETADLGKGRRESLARHLMLSSLKTCTRDAVEVSNLVDHAGQIARLNVTDPVEVGTLLCLVGAQWREAFLLAHLYLGLDWQRQIQAVCQLGLQDCHMWKPLVTGTDILGQFPDIPPKDIGPALQRCLHWQFAHPHARRQEALQHLDTFVYSSCDSPRQPRTPES